MKKQRSPGERYSAKLLFQYRVVVRGRSNVMRTCEERMVVLKAKTARAALALAKRRGKTSQFLERNSDGNPVHFEFVGVLDLLCLGPECLEDEVWYDIRSIKKPMERARALIPPERKLNAIYWADANKPLKKRRAQKSARAS
jgi:hypothetical protein